MKKRFTILSAALALLAFLVIPMGMKGQTRTNQTAFYGFETGDAGWTATTFVTNNTAITAHGGSKYGATNGSTASLQFNTKVANPQSLTCYYSKTTTNNHASSKFSIQVSTNNTTWTTVAEGLTMDQVTKGTWYELSADLSSYTDVYVRVRYDGTTGVRALDDITLIYDEGPAPSSVTATLTQNNLELTGSYSSNASKTIDGITYVHTDLMKNSNNIQAKASSGTIKNTTAYPGDITSVVITHSGTARATTINGSADGTNWTQVATGSGSITADFSGKGYKYFQITRGSNAAYWEKIDITYSTSSSSLTDSDLAITNASTALSFDLYNNNAAQTITYTTSSSGAITITPATSEYFSYVHDATAKTITVTPTAVTPSAQTVTINQAADDDYYAGSASFTVSIANSDPNVPGTQNNPYTVAQAIANTPSSGNVYIQGIVSSFYNTSIVGDGSNYRYYISDDGTTTTQLLVYKGKGLNQATFTNADDLLVGDEVVIYGTLITYQNAPEVASGNYLYSWNRPVAAVEAPTFSPVAGTYTEAQNVTISCTTTGANIYYTTDGTEPTSASTPYTTAIAISTTTTIKAIAYVGNESSTVATATYHFCSAEDPYTVTEALAFNEYPANGIYVHGIVSTAPTQNPTSNGELTYYISVDGEAANQLEVYKGKGLNQAAFDSQNDIQVGDIVTIYGNVVIYNGTKEFTTGNYLVSFERPAQQYTLTVTCSENVEIFTFVGESTEPGVEGSTTLQVTNGTEVGLSVSVPEGYVLTLVVDGTDVTSQLDETGYYTFSMPAHDVTVSATAVEVTPPTPFEPATYTLATSIESGKTYIIVGQGDGKYYAMGRQKSNNRDAVQISVDGITATVLNEAVYEFTISSLADAGFYSIYDSRTPGYLYAASPSSNHLKTEDDLTVNSKWAITFDNEGNVSVVATNSDNRNVMQFNSTSSNKLFSCYASASQHPVSLYVKDETTPDYYTLTINGYTEGSRGGYYLIASPVTVDPATVGGMTEGDFDLYYYDQAQDREWINYKVGDDGTGGPFNLTPGTGYLYAKKATPETMIYNFNLVGTPYSGNGEVFLHKSVENEIMSGWNLVGNPFAQTAYIERDFYVMKDNGEEIITANRENNEVNMMEGVFVIANSDNEPLTFSTTPIANSGSKLVLNLSQGRGIVDRAIVRFGEGRTLPKFMLNNENTKLYIPQEGNDYAVVYAEDQGELPLNFKAAEDGTYTLSFSNENTEFSSLHLIDNMSRADIDLLANPSYTFDAQATDEETRFTLVYEKAGSTLTIGTGTLYSGSGSNLDPDDNGQGSFVGNTYYTASTSQFIYMASEMEGAKTINSLAFYHNNQGSFVGTVKIYLDHTSASQVYTSNPATSGTLVYEGTNINIGGDNAGWQTFPLDTPFEYDGTHNLLVVVCRTKATSGNPKYNANQGWRYSSYSSHYYSMVRSGNDNVNGSIINTSNYYRTFKRPNIKFGYTAPVVNHFDLDIKGWTSNNNNYYLIASPIGQVNPSDVTNMLSNSYDLFYFDQAGDDQGYEWITYKTGEGATDPGFNLVPGKGYLYANSGVATNNPNIVTLTFTGSAYTGSGQVNLVFTEENPVPYMRGWNLVGNPFGVDAYIDRSYYAMNSDGTEIEPHSGVIAPMQGLFVHVDQNETMTFTTTPPSKGSSLSLNVSKGRGIIDRAILNFSEGRQLPKFQLNPNHTKVYMPVEGTDYAVISTEEQGEMPVSFKAEENGTYTFSFDTENVELGYLHLIDNKTGVNVDLLSTPSYSFEAKTTDYESRFKLVFATICEDADGDSETFAFYSNGSFVINNEGVATLQVIDVMGRIISSESINGSANVNINAADGVYMLRLINGERVKTQKVVVK